MKRNSTRNQNYLKTKLRSKRFCPSLRNHQWYLDTLAKILSGNDQIIILQRDGDLFSLLNSSSEFSNTQVYDLLLAFNQYVTNTNTLKSTKDIFGDILRSNFIVQYLEPIVRSYFERTPTATEIVTMITFLGNGLELFPSQFLKNMNILVPCLKYACDGSTKELFDIFETNFESAKAKISCPDILMDLECVVGNFRTLSVIPKSSDIFCSETDVPLRPNKFAGESGNMDCKYDSVDDYLDTQFRLLKEDFVRPLREGIKAIKGNLESGNRLNMQRLQVRLYRNVTIDEMLITRNGLVHKIKFDVSKLRNLNWQKSRRFIYGSLLCFTSDFFDTLYFASVAESDPKQLRKGHLIVQFNKDPLDEVLDNKEFIMLETKHLFEAYRHVLSKLQLFTEDTLPFKENFVFARNETREPEYLKDPISILMAERSPNYGSTDSMDDDTAITTNAEASDMMKEDSVTPTDNQASEWSDLDSSQRVAFDYAIKSHLSIIQGPPGTGKTYVGLKIIKHIINNYQSKSERFGPILVVCYTNHALDQFLVDIIKCIGAKNVIRVGGRSKMNIMKECNLTAIKGEWVKDRRFSGCVAGRSSQNRKDLKVYEVKLRNLYLKLDESRKRLLPLDVLYSFMNEDYKSHFESHRLDTWIMGKESELTVAAKRYSNIMTTERDRLIKDVVRDMLRAMLGEAISKEKKRKENPQKEVETNDVQIEDPDDVLIEQRVLDGDLEIIKGWKKCNQEDDNVKQTPVGKFVRDANERFILKRLSKVRSLTDDEYGEIASIDCDFNGRLELYKYWLRKYRRSIIKDYKVKKKLYKVKNEERDEIQTEETVEIMKSRKVIGLTTTGAARFGKALDLLGCRVVMLEEAAEIMEAHVVCSLSKACEHLIMIGDHKQLRPKVEVYDLEQNYNLGISLFERLVVNKCPYVTLQSQHRMRPEISACVKSIYPKLEDNANVLKYESIKGMKVDVYFFCHEELEAENIETSYKNDFEAEFVANLCSYLIRSGNQANGITVLTFYTGQLYNISDKMQNEIYKGIRICVVDNYQGEENEIIILSLVRSNEEDRVGFVRSPNRLCVALSRAKRGFYVIGNISLLSRHSPLIKTVTENQIDERFVGNKMPLNCTKHPDENNYFVTMPKDLLTSGCPSECKETLTCGHLCNRLCHRDNPSHKSYLCKLPCNKICKRNIHQCKLQCWLPCICREKMILELDCCHKQEIICNQKNIRCVEMCERTLECGHPCKYKCHEPCKCDVPVEKILQCGHVRKTTCSSDISKIKCGQVCNKILECGHSCVEKCYLRCICREMVEYEWPCSHRKPMYCGTDISLVLCSESVSRTFDCGHSVTFKCHQNINKCNDKIKRKLKCGHSSDVGCGENIRDVVCEYICGEILECRHKCFGSCGQCVKGRIHVNCEGICRKYMNCGHNCDAPCHSGFCPPCLKLCTGYCQHSRCSLVCGSACDNDICELPCSNLVECTSCNRKGNCLRLCGQPCSRFCRRCRPKQPKTLGMFHFMDPCNCYISVKEFKPQRKIISNQLLLVCQRCHKDLRSPYRGIILRYFKEEYSFLFETLDEEQISRWNTLLDDLKTLNCVPEKFSELIVAIGSTKICIEDMVVFHTSYNFYLDIKDICKTLTSVIQDGEINKYAEDIRNALLRLILWLNPFFRNYRKVEFDYIKLEKSKSILSLDILSYIDSVTVPLKPSVRKELLQILHDINRTTELSEFKEHQRTVSHIKGNTSKTNLSENDDIRKAAKVVNDKDLSIGKDKDVKLENDLKLVRKVPFRKLIRR